MKWVRTRVSTSCAFGDDVPRGVLALSGHRGWRHYGRRFVVCREHAASEYGMVPPEALEGGPVRDGKALAVGRDE